MYRQNVTHAGGGFSASPVAADGKVYLSGEDGEVFVVKVGPTFELIAKNNTMVIDLNKILFLSIIDNY